MKTVAVFEAKNRLSEILAAVEHGQEYTVTRHGAPVARIVPAHHPQDAAAKGDASEFIARIKATRKGSKLTDDEYQVAVEEGRD